MTYGTINVDLKDTKVEEQKPSGFLGKILSFFSGPRQVEKEVVTQMQYLESMYNVLKELGYENIVSLDINGNNVYYDEEHKKEDLRTAIDAALKEEQKEIYAIEMEFETLDENEDTKDAITLKMYSTHEVGEFPLVIDADLSGDTAETKVALDKLNAKIAEKFGVEAGEVEVEEDEFVEEEEEEDTDSEEEEETDSEEEI